MRKLLLSTCLLVSLHIACSDSGSPPTEPEPEQRRPAALEEIRGGGQSAQVAVQLPDPIEVQVKDQHGDPVGGVNVAWEIVAGSGSVSAPSSATGSDGNAAVRWTLGTAAGIQRLRARVQNVTTALEFTATAEPDAPALVQVSPDTLVFHSIEQTRTAALEVEDRFGNPIASPSAIWAVDDTAVATVDAAGVVRSRASGRAVLSAVVDTARGEAAVEVEQQVAFVVVTPAADTINAIGFGKTATAAVADANGFSVAGATVSWSTLDDQIVSVGPSGGITALSTGVARVVASSNGAADTALVLVRQVPVTVNILPEVDTVSAGSRTQFEVAARDSNAVAIPGLSATWSSSDTTVALIDGSGTATGKLARTAVITAVVGEGVSNAATLLVVPGPAASVDPHSGNAQEGVVGEPLAEPLVVQVLDEFGNPVAAVTVTWLVEGGTLSPEAESTDSEGRARAIWTLGPQPGGQTARAEVESLAAAVFDATAEAGPPAVLELMGGDGQIGEVGQELGHILAVRVLDGHGNPLGGVPVVWQASYGAVGAHNDETWADGRAHATWVLGTVAGAQTSRVEAGDLAYEFVATATPGPHARTVLMGDSIRWIQLGMAPGEAPAVRLEDAYGNGIAGHPVRFGSGSDFYYGYTGDWVTDTVTVTDASGVASAGAWSIPDTVGAYDVATQIEAAQARGPTFVVHRYRPLHLDSVWGAQTAERTCGLDAVGRPICWASGERPTVYGDGSSYVQLALGNGIYGLTAAGAVHSLGPTSAALDFDSPAFSQLIAGQNFRCGLEGGGVPNCWGSNGSGQTGSSPGATSVAAPTPVVDSPTLITLAAGWEHACGLTADGAAYCWGRNDWGQLGDSTQENRWHAVEVGGGRFFVELSLGNRYSCGLEAGGAVYCWGREFIESAPYEVPRLEATRVAEGWSFVEIAAGGYHTCARTIAGRVYCWGLNSSNDYSFGDGTTNQIREEPGPIAGDLVFASIDASWHHTCGIMAEGTVCWGAPNLLGNFPFAYVSVGIGLPAFPSSPY